MKIVNTQVAQRTTRWPSESYDFRKTFQLVSYCSNFMLLQKDPKSKMCLLRGKCLLYEQNSRVPNYHVTKDGKTAKVGKSDMFTKLVLGGFQRQLQIMQNAAFHIKRNRSQKQERVMLSYNQRWNSTEIRQGWSSGTDVNGLITLNQQWLEMVQICSNHFIPLPR